MAHQSTAPASVAVTPVEAVSAVALAEIAALLLIVSIPSPPHIPAAAAVAVVPLLAAIHLVMVRVMLVREAQHLLRPMRRLLNRWLTRFSFLWIGLPGYGAMTVPILGVVLGVATFALLTSIVQVSTAVSLDRERAGKDLARWEKLVPVVLAVVTIGLILAAIGIALLIGWSVTSLLKWV